MNIGFNMKDILVRISSFFTIFILIIGISVSSVISSNIIDKKLPFRTDHQEIDFDKKIEELMKDAHMPSLVACIVKNNTMAWSNAYGFYRYYQNKITSEEIIYPIASITKSFTATAIMQLNESGKIGLDDNISKYLNFDLKNPYYKNINITPRMLLAHQSSLADNSYRYNIIFFWLKYPMDNFEEYFIPGGKIYNNKIWKDYPPGNASEYCTTGFEILGYIIEKITNQSIEDYYQENIFKPLNMTNTSFYVSNFNKSRICGLYIWLGGFYIPIPIIDYGFPAGGGIKTTLLDLSHYLIMHTNSGVYDGVRILKEESVDEMHRIQYPGSYDGKALHGLGWYSFPSRNCENYSKELEYGGHMGSYVGAQSLMHLRYSDNMGIILLWNQNSDYINDFLNIKRPDERYARIEIEKALFNKADKLIIINN